MPRPAECMTMLCFGTDSRANIYLPPRTLLTDAGDEKLRTAWKCVPRSAISQEGLKLAPAANRHNNFKFVHQAKEAQTYTANTDIDGRCKISQTASLSTVDSTLYAKVSGTHRYCGGTCPLA